MDGLELLTSRVSVPVLAEPGPTEQQYRVMMQVALRAPDHASLRPFRFLRVTGDKRDRLGELLVEAALAIDPNLSEGQQERMRKAPLRAPDLLLPILCPSPHPKVPEVEQLLALGAAVSNILNAAFAMGVGAMWRTGMPSYQRSVAEGLGLAEDEKLYGFLYLGTPQGNLKKLSHAVPDDLLMDW